MSRTDRNAIGLQLTYFTYRPVGITLGLYVLAWNSFKHVNLKINCNVCASYYLCCYV